MELTNDTLLRGFVAHMQSIARRRAALFVAATEHPDAKGPPETRIDAIQEQWEIVRRDVMKVLEVQLKPWHELCLPGPPESHVPFAGRDDLRITFRVLKARCDKARLKDPSITLLKSWDLAKH